MKEMYKNILIQGWMLDYIDGMSAEDRKKYLHCLIESALAGKVITDNPQWKRFLEKALSDIEETRDNYYQRQARNAEYSSIEKFCRIDKYRNKILVGTSKDRREVISAIEKNFPNLGPSDNNSIRKIFRKMRKEYRNSIIGGETPKSEKKSIYTIAEEFAKERKEKATDEELDVLEQMEELGIPNIEFQKPVFIKDKNGKPYKFYIADFLDTKNKIDIEIDGGYHTIEEQKMKDSIRDDDFREMGYDIFRITNDQVNSGKAMGLFKDFYRKRQIATTFNV